MLSDANAARFLLTADEAVAFVMAHNVKDRTFVYAIDFSKNVLVFVPLAVACETDSTASNVLRSASYMDGNLTVNFSEEVKPIAYSPGEFRHICAYPALTEGHFISVARDQRTSSASRVVVNLKRPSP